MLTIGVFDWFHPAIWLPRDLHRIVLYSDGTLIRVEASTPTSLAFYSTTLSAAEVDALLVLADRAGLDDGRILPPEPSPNEVMDGAWTIFTRRTDSGVGQVIVDQVGEDEQASDSPRAVLAELLQLVPWRDRGTWQEVPVELWAIESAQPLSDLATVDWPWPDLDSRDLAWKYNDSGVRCAIVTKADWEYTYEEASSYSALESGLFRRPLLPGESSCEDVFAWRAVLGFNDRMTVAPTGLP